MNSQDAVGESWDRLADALAEDLLGADAAEVRESHPGGAARVRADVIRQALRRRATGAMPDDGEPRDPLRELTMRPQRESKR